MNWLSDDAIFRIQAASALPDLTGTRYRLIERIGSGGMGTIYLAEDSVLGRRVALKVVDVPGGADEWGVRLLREAEILARLEHPGMIPVHDAGTLADGRVFYAMKFVEGERLDRLAAGRAALSDRLRLFQRICEAVSFAHARGILHRDLKPENVMVGPFGEVLVMDWGIAKILPDPRERGGEESRDGARREARTSVGSSASSVAPGAGAPAAKTGHGVVLGTPGYMAPEQARGDVEKLDERADVYSLGAILRFLSGSEATRALAAIAQKALAEDRTARYESAGALGLEVARYLDGLPVSAYPENMIQRTGRWVARYRVAIILVLTYLAVRAAMLFLPRH